MLNYAINIKVKDLCGSDNYLLLEKKNLVNTNLGQCL